MTEQTVELFSSKTGHTALQSKTQEYHTTYTVLSSLRPHMMKSKGPLTNIKLLNFRSDIQSFFPPPPPQFGF